MITRRVARSESQNLPRGPAGLFKRIQLWETALLKVTFRIDMSRELPWDYLGITYFPFLPKAFLPRFRAGAKRLQRPSYTRHVGLEISIISCFISNAVARGAPLRMQPPRAESNRQVRRDSVSNVCEFSGHRDCFSLQCRAIYTCYQTAGLRQTVRSENSRGNGT